MVKILLRLWLKFYYICGFKILLYLRLLHLWLTVLLHLWLKFLLHLWLILLHLWLVLHLWAVITFVGDTSATASQLEKIDPTFSSFAEDLHSKFIALNLNHPRIFFVVDGFVI